MSDAVSIRLASPEDIRGWSSGAITRADFLKDSFVQPHPDGLFSERIFGPLFDWCCGCRLKERPKYWGPDSQGQVCPTCGVCIDQSLVRRQRMGHIELAVPIVHTWFLWQIAGLLDMRFGDLKAVVASQIHVILDAGESGRERGGLIDDLEYIELRGQEKKFTAETGGRVIRQLLEQLDLDQYEEETRAELGRLWASRKRALRTHVLSRALKLLPSLRTSGNKPEWMVLQCLPVLPPDLRPLRELPATRTRYCSDLNLFYDNILRINNRLQELQERGAPSAVLRDQARQLQRSVDALFDNERCESPVKGASRRPLKSLSELLQGKQGRFRQNLLGKRVDYSGRGVIVVEPKLKLHQCGLPRVIAIELFRPHLIGRLARHLHGSLPIDWPAALRSARFAFDGRDADVRRTLREAMTDVFHDSIDDIIKDKPALLESWLQEALRDHRVLLNRAPSLHRMSIQAFEPVLHEGKTILLHPLACEGFGADFDGDTMAVHLPLSDVAQEEAERLMQPVRNLLSPASGRPLVPGNEIVLGCYYLTADCRLMIDDLRLKTFANPSEVMLAWAHGKQAVHDPIRVRLPLGSRLVRDANQSHIINHQSSIARTTVGRVLFNQELPAGMPFYDLPLSRKTLAVVINDCFHLCGRVATGKLLDRIKDLGFEWATRSGLSFIVDDLLRPSNKDAVLHETQRKIEEARQRCVKGEIDDEQRYQETVRLWQKAEEAITTRLIEEMRTHERDGLPYLNPLFVMAHSGARSKWVQVRQLAGMRGLMARPSGRRRIVEHAITSSLREGLSVFEYWVSTHGARKAGADKDALPESGDLTRKLVDVAHHVIITENDCRTIEGRAAPLDHARGRVSLVEVEGLLDRNELITRDAVIGLQQAGYTEVMVRSPMTCAAERGVCRLCYGLDLARNALVEIGTAVGILAAQSIGEPGTQLALKTKHTGGIVTAHDMVSGLGRIKALLEVWSPRRPALLAECDGIIDLRTSSGDTRVLVRSDEERPWVHGPVSSARLRVQPGDKVRRGEALTTGDPWPDDLLRLRGISGVRRYFLEECQNVYRANGVMLDDKHFEVILSCILHRWRVEESGDGELLPGAIVNWRELESANLKVAGRVRILEAGSSKHSKNDILDECDFLALSQQMADAGKQPPLGVSATPITATPLGLTRAAMHVESFLSAASFQNTRKVLMEAALAGRRDPLLGLKENVLLGRLIPAGTGFNVVKERLP
jgi:DNA-directed RNA polymerase subunit beta'